MTTYAKSPEYSPTILLASCPDSVKYEDMGEAGMPGRLYFRRRSSVAFNIALVAQGGHLWTSNLAPRDYFREHPEVARGCEEIKLAAFKSGIRSLLAYSNYKSEVMTRLVNLALKSTLP